jgi:hypothetical protein
MRIQQNFFQLVYGDDKMGFPGQWSGAGRCRRQLSINSSTIHYDFASTIRVRASVRGNHFPPGPVDSAASKDLVCVVDLASRVLTEDAHAGWPLSA